MKLTKAKHVSKEAFETLLREVHSCLTSTDTPGSFRIEKATYDSLFPLLADVTNFPESIHRTEVSGALWKAVRATKEAEDASLESFFRELGVYLDQYQTLPFRNYSMWTKVHIKDFPLASKYLRFQINDVRLMLARRLPESLEVEPHFVSGIGQVDPEKPSGGVYLIARGRGKTDTRAGDTLTQAMDDLVIALNYPFLARLHRWSIGRDRPKSALLLGPYQHLVGPGSKKDSDRIWYTPDFDEDHWNFGYKTYAEIKRIAPWVRKFLLGVEEHPCGGQLRRALRLLGDGWASPRTSYRLLRSWTAVETLFSESPDKADNYETIIRRASFLSTENEIRRWKLRHAAQIRNSYVHQNREGIELENITGDLDRYICAVMNWLIFEEPTLSHRRFLDFVEQPRKIELLRKRKEDAQKAIDLFQKD